MQQDLKHFASQWLRVVIVSLAPVVLTAFVSIPWNLERVPGSDSVQVASVDRHMT